MVQTLYLGKCLHMLSYSLNLFIYLFINHEMASNDGRQFSLTIDLIA